MIGCRERSGDDSVMMRATIMGLIHHLPPHHIFSPWHPSYRVAGQACQRWCVLTGEGILGIDHIHHSVCPKWNTLVENRTAWGMREKEFNIQEELAVHRAAGWRQDDIDVHKKYYRLNICIKYRLNMHLMLLIRSSTLGFCCLLHLWRKWRESLLFEEIHSI